MYKRIFKIILLSITFIFLSLHAAYASDETYTSDSPTIEKVVDRASLFHDIDELKAEIPQILYMVNEYGEEIKSTRQLTADDIDWTKLTKMYSPSVSLLIDNPDIDSFMKDAIYIWTLPIDIESHTVVIIFNRTEVISDNARLLLTAEELADLESYLGKWRAVGCQYFDHTINYQKDIESVLFSNNLLDGYEYYTLTALYGINMPVTIVMKDNASLYVFPTMSETREFINKYNIPVIGNAETGIYSYSDVIAICNNYLNEKQLSYFGTGVDAHL